MARWAPTSTLFPYTTLFRSYFKEPLRFDLSRPAPGPDGSPATPADALRLSEQEVATLRSGEHKRSEEHTSELQSHVNLVCRLLLEKKNHTLACAFIIQSRSSTAC